MTRTSDHQAMLRAYLDISQMILEDDGYRRRLAETPKAELAAAGWPLEAGTTVEVSFFDPNEIEGEMVPIEKITTGWAAGIESGRLEVQFAGAPPPALEITELSEEELTEVAAGFCVASAIGPMPPPGLP
jgi:hypothetical protein